MTPAALARGSGGGGGEGEGDGGEGEAGCSHGAARGDVTTLLWLVPTAEWKGKLAWIG
jgi:hypothetical protein